MIIQCDGPVSHARASGSLCHRRDAFETCEASEESSLNLYPRASRICFDDWQVVSLNEGWLKISCPNDDEMVPGVSKASC